MADRQRADRSSSRPRHPTRTKDSARRTAGGRPSASAGPSAAGSPGAATARRPRLTGRSAILVLLLAVLAVSYASSAKAYLNQRSHISDLKAQIATRTASIQALETEKQRWHDPAFLERQARQRFQFVLPGETSLQVLDPDGRALDDQDQLHSVSAVVKKVPTAWYDTAWASMEAAGKSSTAK